MSRDGGPSAGAGVTYGVDIGGTKVLGVALGPDHDIVAEGRVPTPRGKREIVGSHVAEAVAQVVVELDRALGTAGATPVGVRVRAGRERSLRWAAFFRPMATEWQPPLVRNQVGGDVTVPTSYTTVRAVRHTAVQNELARR